MASNQSNYCDPCLYSNLTNQAEVWCLSCEEGLCRSCMDSHKRLKATRHHKVLPVEESGSVSSIGQLISLNCKAHDKALDFYCSKHGIPLCSLCIAKAHRDCDILCLDEVAKDVASSSSLLLLEEEVDSILEGLSKLEINRTKNLERVENEEMLIQAAVNNMRIKINDKLDSLERVLKEDLSSSHEHLQQILKTAIADLIRRRQKISEIKSSLSTLKQLATNTQLFVAIVELRKEIDVENSLLCQFAGKEEMNEFSLKLETVDVKRILDYKSFGTVSILSSPGRDITVSVKSKAAQIPVQPIRDISCVKTTKKVTFPVGLQGGGVVNGCMIATNGDLMFCNDEDRTLAIYNSDGMFKNRISLPARSSDLEQVSEERFVITYGISRMIQVANIRDNMYNAILTIRTEDACWGITFENNKLITKVTFHGVIIFNLDGSVFKEIPELEAKPCFYNVANFDGKIYISNRDANHVQCSDMDGNEVWRHKCPFMISPRGITLDRNGNVFVACEKSRNLVIISPDGKTSKSLHKFGEDGWPISISFSKQRNELLVRERTRATLLSVFYK